MIDVINVRLSRVLSWEKLVTFANREAAGHTLGRLLSSYQGHEVVILGLVRGGVVIAHTIASDLNIPFDALVVKKIPFPENGELAIGAVAPNNITYINTDLVGRLQVSRNYIKNEIWRLSSVIANQERLYRGNNESINVDTKIVILVDDGIATGATMKAAIQWCRKHRAKEIIVAVPVAPSDTISEIAKVVDRVVVIEKPRLFHAVGQFYREFEQVEDKEVIYLLIDRKTIRQ